MQFREGGNKAVLWLAFVGCVMLAGWIVMRVVQSFYPSATFLVPVADIPPFTPVTAAHFAEILLPEAAVSAFPDALRPGDDLTGKVARHTLMKGMLVSKHSLGEQGDGSSLTLLPKDARSSVITLSMSRTSALSGALQPGEQMDLYVWYKGVVYLLAPRLQVLRASPSPRDESVIEVTVEVPADLVNRVSWAAAESQGSAVLVAVAPGAQAPTPENIPFADVDLKLQPGEQPSGSSLPNPADPSAEGGGDLTGRDTLGAASPAQPAD